MPFPHESEVSEERYKMLCLWFGTFIAALREPALFDADSDEQCCITCFVEDVLRVPRGQQQDSLLNQLHERQPTAWAFLMAHLNLAQREQLLPLSPWPEAAAVLVVDCCIPNGKGDLAAAFNYMRNQPGVQELTAELIFDGERLVLVLPKR